MGLYFSKEGQKEDFKIVMQIYADEWISFNLFLLSLYCFPKSRQKVFNYTTALQKK